MSSNSSGTDFLKLFERFMPMVFVVIWATGFITAKYALPYAEPFTVLSYRMVLVLVLLLPLTLLFSRTAFKPDQVLHSMISGVFIHALYLGGVFFAISRGMPAGVSALVVAIQPLLTVLIARIMLGENMSRAQLWWFFVALFGVFLIVWPKLEIDAGTTGINPVTLIAVLLAAFGISFGTVYQKRFVKDLGLRLSTSAQYFGAGIVLLAVSFLFETREVHWNPQFISALAWMVIPLSLGSVALLMILIRKGSSASVASMFYLVPAVSAVMAYFLFGEVLTLVQLTGGAVIILAVALASRSQKSPVV